MGPNITKEPKLKVCHTISYQQGYMMRGIAMVMIIFVHCLNEYVEHQSILAKFLLIPKWGEIASSIFFFMSGFGIFTSMTKQETLHVQYLYRQLKKIIIPFFIAFLLALPAIIISHYFHQEYQIRLTNICMLSMPDGTNMWFLKTILLFYIIAFVIVRFISSKQNQLLALFVLLLVDIIISYITKQDGYWYYSNLCFAAGAFGAIGESTQNERWRIWVLVILSIGHYICFVKEIHKAPLEIIGNTAYTGCFVLAILQKKFEHRFCSFFIFIGKNSLLYYVLNIPIMISLPGEYMHWATYFATNIILTTLAVMLYNVCKTQISTKINILLRKKSDL